MLNYLLEGSVKNCSFHLAKLNRLITKKKTNNSMINVNYTDFIKKEAFQKDYSIKFN